MCCFDLCIRGACCCCEACCNDVCRSLKRFFTLSIRQQMRLAYLALFFSFIASALALMFYAPSSLGMWTHFIHCPAESISTSDSLACLGVSAIYRMSFSLVILFTSILCFVLLRNEASKFVNENFWFQKILGVIGLFFAQMWLPNSFYVLYGSTFAKILGIIFALFQIVMCIDLAYSWSESWVKKYEEGFWIYEYLLYIASIGMYVLAGTLIYSNYEAFPCASNQNLGNIIAVVLISILNLCPFNTKPSVLVSGAVSLLITYFSWAALMNEQEESCNAYARQFKNTLGGAPSSFLQSEGIIGIGIIVVALAYITFGEADEQDKSRGQSDVGNLMASMRKSEAEDEENSGDEDDFFLPEINSVDMEMNAVNMKKARVNQKTEATEQTTTTTALLVRKELARLRELRIIRRMKDYSTNTYVYFHVIMILSSCYIAMLLTNYGALSVESSMNWSQYQTSQQSYVIKVSLSYITAATYIWTILAPIILTDRQF